jgi:hypothetical protein
MACFSGGGWEVGLGPLCVVGGGAPKVVFHRLFQLSVCFQRNV